MTDNEKALLEKIKKLEEKINKKDEEIIELEEKIEEYEEEESEEQRYIETWNKDLDRFHRDAYGTPTPEEGGIRDHSFDKIEYNEGGEPIGYC